MKDKPSYDKNLRRLTGLWRFGREVLPTAHASFEAFLFQLDTLIDGKAPNPLAACPRCGSQGFAPSALPGQCEFCDGTEGGNSPLASGKD